MLTAKRDWLFDLPGIYSNEPFRCEKIRVAELIVSHNGIAYGPLDCLPFDRTYLLFLHEIRARLSIENCTHNGGCL